VLFVHEVHQVIGRHAEAFETAYRDGWTPALCRGDGARLLWYLDQAHGTGAAYTVVTVTAIESALELSALSTRLHDGDLTQWARKIDGLRHDVVAKVLEPVAWSPMIDVDLASILPSGPDRGADRPLFMEDTAWPHPGRFHDYLELASTRYVETLRRAAEHDRNLLDLVAAFTPLYGTGHQREVVLWQRVARPELLLPLLRREVPAEHRGPGSWMHDALDVRDRWESRLLRAASWSPLG
jgi:hypothetical protein